VSDIAAAPPSEHARASARAAARRLTGRTVAAAGALLVGCGVLAGCASGTAGSAGTGTPPKLLIGAGGAGNAPMAAAAPAAGAADGAALAPAPNGRFAPFGGYVLAGTLPDQPTHAPVMVWPDGKTAENAVAHLATALGLTGTPQRHRFGWELTTTTGDLRVRDGAGAEWSYERADARACPDYQVDVDNPPDVSVGVGCAMGGAVGPVASATAGSAPDAVAAPPGPPPAPPAGPDENATRAAAAPLLSALKVSGHEQVDVGAPTSTVSVSPLVDGMPTEGIETRVEVDGQGVRAASGRLELPQRGADYPLQTATAAFAALGSGPRPMIAQYCESSPMPAPPVGSASDDTVGAPVQACATPQPQQVTGAVLGLQLEYDATGAGSQVLVPAWFFTIAGSDYPQIVIAVDPAFIGDPNVVPGTGASSTGASGGGGSAGVIAPGSPVEVPPAPPADSSPAAKPTG
jgi:hypothetical protein